ncbi:hypothetical protein BST61_g1009 [Cercospora zeina]
MKHSCNTCAPRVVHVPRCSSSGSGRERRVEYSVPERRHVDNAHALCGDGEVPVERVHDLLVDHGKSVEGAARGREGGIQRTDSRVDGCAFHCGEEGRGVSRVHHGPG